MAIPSLEALWASCKNSNHLYLPPDIEDSFTVVGIDPGYTTGVAVLNAYKNKPPELKSLLQLDTSTLGGGCQRLAYFLDFMRPIPTVLFGEDYRVYGTHTQQHTWAELHTPKLVGACVMYAELRQLSHYWNMAGSVKNLFSNANLASWGFTPKEGFHKFRHASDALRHALNGVLFGNPQFNPTIDARSSLRPQAKVKFKPKGL